MSFGGYGRNPEEVQRHNGQHYDFKKIAERYETTVPLRGKRKAMNIRPHGERNRDWERIVKVSDNEYYLTNNAYRYYDKYGYSPCRAITFKRNDDGTEVLIVHTPRKYWGDKPEDREIFLLKQIGVPSTYYFYSCNLPHGMSMYKYYSKNYLAVKHSHTGDDIGYYTLDKGDVHLTRQVGDEHFKPLIVHREVHRSLDRNKTKAIRQELSSFAEYVRVMTPLIPSDRQQCYSSPLYYAQCKDKENQYAVGSLGEKCIGKGWRGVFTGEDNELWFNLVQYYKHMQSRNVWNPVTHGYDELSCDPKSIIRAVTNQVYQHEKPLHEEPVELGVRTFDKYRNW
jgi:hypothetical protein